ncbi:MAG TPA: glycoside hydrolase family 2 TIM barrel-domain containing protein, partial [Treponemataceae bacterium]|nr:glycoside hydrolase family 2 TIM barrel-domain containing protein [Treponemataceae bacterium]
ENEVLVRVLHRSPNSRWYSGAGIYRNVHLIQKNTLHIKHNGLYISTKKNGPVFSVSVSSSLSSQTDNSTSIHHTIIDAEGAAVSFSKGGCEQNLIIAEPHLWSLENPYLYTLKTEVFNGDTLCDSTFENFGLRTLTFTPDKGFFLNDSYVKIHGACQHHDLGCLGSAFNKTAARRQLLKLIEMGVNAVRTSHNPFPKDFLDLCDELGILVMSEFLDMWENAKTEFDYARFFNEWVEKDAESWITQGRNHPCVIMWSVGNEIHDTHAGKRGKEVMERLISLVEKFDPKHNARATLCSNYMPWENTQKCADVIKLIGYNYAEKYYDEHHKDHPDWIIYGSETASVVFSRGIYHFPLRQQILNDDDGQCSALGNSSTSWGAKSVEGCIIDDRDANFCLGQFIWTGWDYIGEPTPYHSKNSFFGQIDTAGFPKDSFYIFKSAWTDYKKDPFVHIFPYWDFSPGQIIDVRVCTNAPLVELFLNGKSLGKKHFDHAKDTSLTLDVSIPYEKGILTASAYDENGNLIAKTSRSSFSDPASITLKTDTQVLYADGRDLCFVEISVEDKDGNPVENAVNRMFISVEGEGRLIGLDN